MLSALSAFLQKAIVLLLAHDHPRCWIWGHTFKAESTRPQLQAVYSCEKCGRLAFMDEIRPVDRLERSNAA